jgi:hypothetical protein
MADQDEIVARKRPDQSRLKVSKEELDASGLSLRDFMNQKQGLTRRDDAPSSGPGRKPSGPKKSEWDDNSTPMKSMPKTESQGSIPIGDTTYSKTVKATGGGGEGSGFLGKKMREAMGSKFAKGGSVSSASSRADGCCVKGKTKGTVVGMKTGGMSC